MADLRRLPRVRPRVIRLGVVASLSWLILVWIARPIVGGDTGTLLRGAEALADCLAEGMFVACGFHEELDEEGQMSSIGPFPWLQYPFALVALAVRTNSYPPETMLAHISILAFAWSVLVSWVVLRGVGLVAWTWGLVLVALSGPPLVYANASWGEMLASGLLVLLVAATVLRLDPVLVGLAVFAASLTKESGYPFVAAIGLVGLLLARRRTGASILAHVVWGTAGLLVGIACATALNVLRFGSAFNTNYLQPEFRAPSWDIVVESALGLVVAPNGGMLFFWPTATVLVTVICLAPLYRALRRGGTIGDVWVALALAAILVGILVGLATWWAPFGWHAWGPRLTLPWVWPLVLLWIVAYGEWLGGALTWWLAVRWRFILTALVIVATTLPHVGFLWRPETTELFFFAETASCVPNSGPGSPLYYECLHEQMWLRDPILVDAFAGLATAGGVVTAAAVAAALIGCLSFLRDELASARATAM